jgi:hypothetical protein
MTTGVIFIGSKFTADVSDKGWWSHLAPDLSADYDDTVRKFATSVNDACGKFADLLPVSVTLVVDSDNNISLYLKYYRENIRENHLCHNVRENQLRIFLKKCFEKCMKINRC